MLQRLNAQPFPTDLGMLLELVLGGTLVSLLLLAIVYARKFGFFVNVSAQARETVNLVSLSARERELMTEARSHLITKLAGLAFSRAASLSQIDGPVQSTPSQSRASRLWTSPETDTGSLSTAQIGSSSVHIESLLKSALAIVASIFVGRGTRFRFVFLYCGSDSMPQVPARVKRSH